MPVLFDERFDFGEELRVLGPAGIVLEQWCVRHALSEFFWVLFPGKVREQWAKGSSFLVRSICNGLSLQCFFFFNFLLAA